MKRAARASRGFTLIELIVVIVVIGILATIAIVGFGKFQADTRDARRAASANVITESLEKYYNKNGEYPSCSQMTADGTTLTQQTLPDINQTDLVAPQASGTTNSIQCINPRDVSTDLNTTSTDFFGYQGDGSTECLGSGACLSYVFKYKDETDNKIVSVNSRHTTSIATSGNITDLQASSGNFSAAALSWTAVTNATSYNIQTSSTNSFTSVTASVSDTAGATITGLTAGNTYYFRVQPVNGSTVGSWSNTASVTIRSLATPVVKVAASSASNVSLSWGAIQYATSYKVQRATNSAFTTGLTEYSQTTTGKSFTDEQAGVTHYYRVIAYASGDTSDPSNTVSMTTASPPAAYSISETDPTYSTIQGTSAAKCATGTTLYYTWGRRVNGTGSYATFASGTSYKSATTSIGWDQTVQVNSYARCQTATYTSAYTGSSNVIGRHLSRPTVQGGISSYRTFSWSGTCPDGTTSYKYVWRIKGDASVNTSGTKTSSGSYSNQGAAWGDGNTLVTLYCYSSGSYGWSGAVTASNKQPFGGGCVPTVTKSICTAN